MVSIIIPSYNYADYLPDALASLLEQSFHDWECIIVNNGSSDNTHELLKPYLENDKRFRYFVIENKGVSHARNFGLSQVKGEFLQFLDADDLIEKEKLKVHTLYLKENKGVDLVYGEARYFTSENKTLRNFSMHQKDIDWMPRIGGKGNLLVWALLRRNIFPINAPLFRKDLIKKFGNFDERLTVLEDWDLWLRFAFHGARYQWLESSSTDALIRIHTKSASQNKKMMHSYLLPILQRNLFHHSTKFTQKLYLFIRYEEELIDLCFFTFKGSFEKVIRSEANSVFTFLFLLCLAFPFFPFYILLKIYRKLFQ